MLLRDLTPRERVWRSIRRQPLDRLPMDFWADTAVWQKLMHHFKTDSKTTILKALKIDIRTVLPTYVGPPIISFPDGSKTTEWGFRVRYVQATSELAIPEYIYPPLGDANSVADVAAHHWPSPDWWDVSDLQAKIDAINQDDEYFIRCHLGSIFEWTWALRGFEQTFVDLGLDSEVTPAIMEHLAQCLVAVGEVP